jgi:hypothetical protein
MSGKRGRHHMKRQHGLRVAAKVLACLTAALTALVAHGAPANAQECPSSRLCRDVAPAGALLHNKNSAGHRIWTTACGPNTTKPRLDRICQEISNCPAAGGFGKFLAAVTGFCKSKQFDGYFGLDGMTFGILDWTADNLPSILRSYQQWSGEKFDDIFRALDLPMKDGCLDPNWVCESNRQGKLMCDTNFHDAFASSLKIAEFQKAQVEYALKTYEKRIARFASLGLKTEYGNTAMVVVANNLLGKEACRPATWKKLCADEADETKLVNCMLQQYADNNCRGSARGSNERMMVIKKVFNGATPSDNIHPTVDAVVACSGSWGEPR